MRHVIAHLQIRFQMKNFVIKLIGSFDVDSGNTRIASMRYSGVRNKGIFAVQHFDDFDNSADIQSKILGMPYSAGLTATGE